MSTKPPTIEAVDRYFMLLVEAGRALVASNDGENGRALEAAFKSKLREIDGNIDDACIAVARLMAIIILDPNSAGDRLVPAIMVLAHDFARKTREAAGGARH